NRDAANIRVSNRQEVESRVRVEFVKEIIGLRICQRSDKHDDDCDKRDYVCGGVQIQFWIVVGSRYVQRRKYFYVMPKESDHHRFLPVYSMRYSQGEEEDAPRRVYDFLFHLCVWLIPFLPQLYPWSFFFRT